MEKGGSSLPQRDSNLFRQILGLYENRQYKKGLKLCEQILKRNPDHGETLALKGLLLNSLDRRDEAHEFVKKGLKKDLKSHVCWHVYGSLHRTEKNYEEAIKCYRHALKIDKDNLQILRDLSLLLIQSRNYEGFTETRKIFLHLRPQQKASWIALAIAHYLQGNMSLSLQIVEAYENTITDSDSKSGLEHSEFLLFKNQLLCESGKFEDALEHLEKHEDNIFDRTMVKEIRADIFMQLGRMEDSQRLAKELTQENPENENYYRLLARSMELDFDKLEDSPRLLELVDQVAQENPRAHTPKRLALRFCEAGEDFSKRMEEYLRKWVQKGAPSLFSNIKHLCQDPKKLAITERVALDFYSSLNEKGSFDGKGEKEAPTSTLWTLYFLSQLFDFKHEFDKALDYVNKALEHTPTIVEIAQQRARVMKHAGDMPKAVECIDQARELDLQDRFINTKCTKYMIRNDMISTAEDTISLFTKAESNDLDTLVELQCMWFALETGYSYLRQKKYGKALKKFHQVDQHFVEFFEDQFDFHFYCMRRMTLRSYIKMLRFEDQIRNHKFYFKGALGAIQCYLILFDKPEDDAESDALEEDKKKALNKQKKAERAKANDSKTKAKAKKVDPDPEGAKLQETSDPLGDATKFLAHLLQFHSKKVESHLMACEIYLRKKKPLLVLKAIKKARALSADDPRLHLLEVRFLEQVKSLSGQPQVVQDLLSAEIKEVFGEGCTPEALNKAVMTKFPHSLPHVLSAARAMKVMSGSDSQTPSSLLSSFDLDSHASPLQTTIESYQFLKKNSPEAAEKFLEKAKRAHKHSSFFNGPEVHASIVTKLAVEDPDA